MNCSNCHHSWCWFCGLPGRHGSGEMFHIFCTLFVESWAIKQKWKKFGALIGIILLIIFLPVISGIILIIGYIYSIIYGTYNMILRIQTSKNQILIRLFIIIILEVLYLAISVVLFAIAVIITIVTLIIIYIILFCTIVAGII